MFLVSLGIFFVGSLIVIAPPFRFLPLGFFGVFQVFVMGVFGGFSTFRSCGIVHRQYCYSIIDSGGGNRFIFTTNFLRRFRGLSTHIMIGHAYQFIAGRGLQSFNGYSYS